MRNLLMMLGTRGQKECNMMLLSIDAAWPREASYFYTAGKASTLSPFRMFRQQSAGRFVFSLGWRARWGFSAG